MNSESSEYLESIAKRAGAIIECPSCGQYDISAGDSEAEKTAYAMATNSWKDGDFRASSREEVLSAMKGVLQDANFDCPQCDQDHR